MKIYICILHIRYHKKRNDGINSFIYNWLRFNYSLRNVGCTSSDKKITRLVPVWPYDP